MIEVQECMSASVFGKLHFTNEIINKHVYINIFADNLISFIEDLNINNFIFQ